MAFVCSDCVTWVNSKDGDRYGRKYCSYSRRYEEADQSIYWLHGRECPGFVWARRSIITKICEILNIDPTKYFKAFDDTKEIYLLPSCIDKLIDYNTVGPAIANKMDNCEYKENIASNILKTYIEPALEKCNENDFQGAVSIYEHMVKVLAIMFNTTKEILEENTFYDNLIKIH